MALVCGMTLAPLISQTAVSADSVGSNASSQVSNNAQCFSGTGRAMQTAQWIKDNPHMSASEKKDAQAKLDDLTEADKKAPVDVATVNKLRSSIQTIYTGEKGLPRMDVWDMYSGTNGGKTITEQQFKDVKADGFKGVVVKATEGTGYVSPTAQSQIDNATKAGLTVSTYHYAWFSSPSEAKSEADYYADRLDKLGVNKKARVILDLEESNTANSKTGDSVRAFFNEMSTRGYVNHGLYTFSGYAQKDAAINAVGGKGKTWMAQYPYTPSANNLLNTDCGAWQYSPMAQIVDTSKNLKISGNNDVSIDYNGLLTRNLTTESSTPVTPTYSASFDFVDKDGKTIGTGKVSGSEGYVADISKYVPSGYQLTSGQTTKYTLGKDTVPKKFKVEKTDNTVNSQITGSISFVDSTTGKEVGTASFGGDEGTTVDVSKMVPQGYDLVNDSDKVLTLKSGMNTKLMIKVKSNGTMNGTETINREEIDFVDANGTVVGKAYATGDRDTSVNVTKDLPADYTFVNDSDKMVLLDGKVHTIKVQKSGSTSSSINNNINSSLVNDHHDSSSNNSSNNNTLNSSSISNDSSESIEGANIAHNDSTTTVDSSSADSNSNPIGGIVGTTTTTNGASAVENNSSESDDHVSVGTTTGDNSRNENASESSSDKNTTNDRDKSSAYTESDADANYKGATTTTNSAKGSSESGVRNRSNSDENGDNSDKSGEANHKMGEGAEDVVKSSSVKDDGNRNDANLEGGTTTTTNGDKGSSIKTQKQASSSESSSAKNVESAALNEGEPDGKAGTANAGKAIGATGFAQTGGTSKFSNNWFYNFIYGSIPNFAHKVVHFFENLF